MTEKHADTVETRAAEGYWQQSRLPLASLVFVAPLLVVYEGGLLMLGTGAMRNGADAWLRQFLAVLGFGQYFLLPFLTVCILLGWHFTTRLRWRFSLAVLLGMALESVALALALWQIARIQHVLLPLPAALAMIDPDTTLRSLFEQIVSYVGAGIYEELLFRVMLFPLLIGLLVQVGVSKRTAIVVSVISTSLLFAAAHHWPGGEPFAWAPFVFRSLAGAFFAVVFVTRGFGIVAGAHTGYDVIVGILGF